MGGESVQCGSTGQRDESRPRWREGDRVIVHHATQNGQQFKTFELFIAGVFHLIFSDHG